jgi:MSHA biogenesis protein MshI
VIAPSQYQIVQVDKPEVPEEEMLSALKWQVKELVTIPPEDMILDYFSGPVLAGGSEKLNVVCSQKSVLKVLVEALDDSDINLKTISTEEFAFASLVPFQEQALMLVCQQPNEEIVILIVKLGRIYFHRRLRGYAQLGAKTMEELSFGAVDSLSLEIQRSSDYFERQLKQAPIKEIQVILPIKTMDYVVTKLGENTNTPVVAFGFEQQHQDKPMYAAAIGATKLNQMEGLSND